MKKTLLRISVAVLAIGSIAISNDLAEAQQVGPTVNGQMIGGDPGKGPYRMQAPGPFYNAKSAIVDFDHPDPFYAHSRGGIAATRTHHWNGAQAMQHSWHGGYYHPQYGQPLSLVVPPTASYQTVYGWGVGSTQSVPLYHQYSRQPGGMMNGGGLGFHRRPYQPTNTQQFGVYYTRAPW